MLVEEPVVTILHF